MKCIGDFPPTHTEHAGYKGVSILRKEIERRVDGCVRTLSHSIALPDESHCFSLPLLPN